MTSFTVLAHQLEQAQASGDILELEHALHNVDSASPVVHSICSAAFLQLEEEVRTLYNRSWETCRSYLVPLRQGCELHEERAIFSALLKCQQAPPNVQLHMYQDMRLAAALRKRLVEVEKEATQLLANDGIGERNRSGRQREGGEMSFSSSLPFGRNPSFSSAVAGNEGRGASHSTVGFLQHSTGPMGTSRSSSSPSASAPLTFSASPYALRQAKAIEHFLVSQTAYLPDRVKEALQRRKEEWETMGRSSFPVEGPPETHCVPTPRGSRYPEEACATVHRAPESCCLPVSIREARSGEKEREQGGRSGGLLATTSHTTTTSSDLDGSSVLQATDRPALVEEASYSVDVHPTRYAGYSRSSLMESGETPPPAHPPPQPPACPRSPARVSAQAIGEDDRLLQDIPLLARRTTWQEEREPPGKEEDLLPYLHTPPSTPSHSFSLSPPSFLPFPPPYPFRSSPFNSTTTSSSSSLSFVPAALKGKEGPQWEQAMNFGVPRPLSGVVDEYAWKGPSPPRTTRTTEEKRKREELQKKREKEKSPGGRTGFSHFTPTNSSTGFMRAPTPTLVEQEEKQKKKREEEEEEDVNVIISRSEGSAPTGVKPKAPRHPPSASLTPTNSPMALTIYEGPSVSPPWTLRPYSSHTMGGEEEEELHTGTDVLRTTAISISKPTHPAVTVGEDGGVRGKEPPALTAETDQGFPIPAAAQKDEAERRRREEKKKPHEPHRVPAIEHPPSLLPCARSSASLSSSGPPPGQRKAMPVRTSSPFSSDMRKTSPQTVIQRGPSFSSPLPRKNLTPEDTEALGEKTRAEHKEKEEHDTAVRVPPPGDSSPCGVGPEASARGVEGEGEEGNDEKRDGGWSDDEQGTAYEFYPYRHKGPRRWAHSVPSPSSIQWGSSLPSGNPERRGRTYPSAASFFKGYSAGMGSDEHMRQASASCPPVLSTSFHLTERHAYWGEHEEVQRSHPSPRKTEHQDAASSSSDANTSRSTSSSGYTAVHPEALPSTPDREDDQRPTFTGGRDARKETAVDISSHGSSPQAGVPPSTLASLHEEETFTGRTTVLHLCEDESSEREKMMATEQDEAAGIFVQAMREYLGVRWVFTSSAFQWPSSSEWLPDELLSLPERTSLNGRRWNVLQEKNTHANEDASFHMTDIARPLVMMATSLKNVSQAKQNTERETKEEEKDQSSITAPTESLTKRKDELSIEASPVPLPFTTTATPAPPPSSTTLMEHATSHPAPLPFTGNGEAYVASHPFPESTDTGAMICKVHASTQTERTDGAMGQGAMEEEEMERGVQHVVGSAPATPTPPPPHLSSSSTHFVDSSSPSLPFVTPASSTPQHEGGEENGERHIDPSLPREVGGTTVETSYSKQRSPQKEGPPPCASKMTKAPVNISVVRSSPLPPVAGSHSLYPSSLPLSTSSPLQADVASSTDAQPSSTPSVGTTMSSAALFHSAMEDSLKEGTKLPAFPSSSTVEIRTSFSATPAGVGSSAQWSSLSSSSLPSYSIYQMRLKGRRMAVIKEEAIDRKDIMDAEEMERVVYLLFSWND